MVAVPVSAQIPAGPRHTPSSSARPTASRSLPTTSRRGSPRAAPR